jgi:P2-related tail formation protein
MKLLDFQEERREYLKTKLNYLERKSTTKTVRDFVEVLKCISDGSPALN